MRLSMAMMLGSTTCKMEAGNINTCAMGAALNAMGVRPCARHGCDWHRVEMMCELWPWLAGNRGWIAPQATNIIQRFDYQVCEGLMTLEQLVDYVRSIEPDCDCNRFNCNCKAQQEVATEVEHVSQT